MNVISTRQNFDYACSELANGLWDIMDTVDRIVREVTEKHASEKGTLVIVKCCPCCSSLGRDIPDDAIMVSPLCGIDRSSYGDRISRIDVYPPYKRNDGRRDGSPQATFEEHWRNTLEAAIKDTKK